MRGERGRIRCGGHNGIGRRDVLAAIGGAAMWPQLARAQQGRLPVIGYLAAGSLANIKGSVDAFRRGLAEMGYTISGVTRGLVPRIPLR